jgi:hypothetical protein
MVRFTSPWDVFPIIWVDFHLHGHSNKLLGVLNSGCIVKFVVMMLS